jgi:solute carrier family 25 aspartate/glutamate transporter 12/13
MTGPEADYKIAFELFDRDKNGKITKEEFLSALQRTRFAGQPFDENSLWMKLFFGKEGKNSINYSEFTQLLKGMESEVLLGLFVSYAKPGPNNTAAVISGSDFDNLLKTAFSERIIGELPIEIRTHLTRIVGDNISYPEFLAFYNVLMNLDRVKHGIILASEQKSHPKVTQRELLRVARRITLFEFTPLETEIVFRIFDTDKDGLISVKDYEKIMSPPVVVTEHERTSFVEYVKETVQHFLLGSIAGAIGAAAVYPIDLVKTRMQNQRFTKESEKLYKNSWDCFLKVVRGEGPRGLYRGIIPQLIGVAPEKAIKLTVNDLLRKLFSHPGGGVYFPLEVLAGGCAGASQVIFTNPIEIVKIRLQVQGEAMKFGVAPKSTITILKELGFRGLYKGAAACLLRDIPFSAIYFPCYAKCKEWLSDPVKGPSGLNLLTAGAMAGIPAASLVTPADVIKTRLQVEARSGQQTYRNIPHCAELIFKTEGFRAFWKGAGMRVFRSSPQFGVTLYSYEVLQKFFMPNIKKPQPPTNAPIHRADYERLGGVGRSVRRSTQRWGLFSHDDDK